MSTRVSHPDRRLRRALVVAALAAATVVVGSTGGPVSAGAPPEHTLALSNDGCVLTIEAHVAQAGSYEVVVLDSSMIQETFPINASGGAGDFTFTFTDAPNPPPNEEVPPFPIVELRLVEGGLLVADSHRLDGCVASAITTTTVPDDTTTTAPSDTTTTAPSVNSTVPSSPVPPAGGAAAIAGRATYTG